MMLRHGRARSAECTRAPSDAFGVGTKLAVMDDASHLDITFAGEVFFAKKMLVTAGMGA